MILFDCEYAEWNSGTPDFYIDLYIKEFFKRDIYHCYYTISDYHSNERSRANTSHELKLCSKSRTIEQSLISVYYVYYVSTDKNLRWIYELQQAYTI
jgi:hypothetical protein